MKSVTLGEWEENIELKTPREEDGCVDSLEPMNSEEENEE